MAQFRLITEYKKEIKKYFLKNLAPKKWKNVKINWSGHESAISELIVLVFIFKQINWFPQQHCDIIDIRHIKNITWVNFSYLFHSTSQTAYFFQVCPKMAQQRFFLPPLLGFELASFRELHLFEGPLKGRSTDWANATAAAFS